MSDDPTLDLAVRQYGIVRHGGDPTHDVPCQVALEGYLREHPDADVLATDEMLRRLALGQKAA